MADDFRELLLGCGHSRIKKLPSLDGVPHWRGLITLDLHPDVDADYVCDLNALPWAMQYIREGAGLYAHLQEFDDLTHVLRTDRFDEVHAYEVLEHLGHLGDAESFFAHFSEIWRILKPGGHLYATVPSRFSSWLWGDPSHRRAIVPESLIFLDQSEYVRQLNGPQKTSMSDFRNIYRADFNIRRAEDNHETFTFVLQAVKPSRWNTK